MCGEIWRQPDMPETQQEPVIYLFLEETLGRHAGVLGSPVQVAYSHPNRHTEAKLKLVRDIYTPQKFRTGLGGNVAPVEAEGLHAPLGKPVPGDEDAGPVPAEREEASLQDQTLPADGLFWPARPGGREGGLLPLHRRPGIAPVSVYCH